MTKDQRGRVPDIDCTDITTSLESLSVDGDAPLRSTATRSVEESRSGLFQLGDSGLPDVSSPCLLRPRRALTETPFPLWHAPS